MRYDWESKVIVRAYQVLDTVQSTVGWGDISLIIKNSPTLTMEIYCSFHSSKGEYAVRVHLSPQYLLDSRDRTVDMYAIGEGERIKAQLKDKGIGMATRFR